MDCFDEHLKIVEEKKDIYTYLNILKNENIALRQEIATLKALRAADDVAYQRMKEVAFNQCKIELPSGDIREI
jgi:hypothetical protein